MSFETKLLCYCDHKVLEDDYCVDTDLQSVIIYATIVNVNNMVVRVNGVPLDRNNKSEILSNDDVSSQATGANTIFLTSKTPIYDGSNRKILAARPTDVIVQVTITTANPEDASAQFTGVETLLVTQHRPLMSPYDIYATQVEPIDVVVTVNSSPVVVNSIEPVFGKIILKQAPPAGATVTASYTYRAHVLAVSALDGRVTIKEKPTPIQKVVLFYYPLYNDGWSVTFNDTLKLSTVVFDQPKQTNQFLVQNEDVSDQFKGIQSYFYTANKLIIPSHARIKADPANTTVVEIATLINGLPVVPQNMDPVAGKIELGFIPKPTDIVTISYNYRNVNIPTDIISIDYQVAVNACRKCNRTSQLNDYDYDKLHDVITVVREQKMLQDLLKLVTAIKGSNTAHPWWGTSLSLYIGTAQPSEYYIPKFKGEIVNAGEMMKDLQTQQTQYQIVDDEEFFSFLDNITVEQNDIDPDFYDIIATVVSQAATAISLDTSLLFNAPLLESS